MVLQKLWQILSPPVADQETALLYQAIVAQARQPAFYESFGIEDSVDGRFDLLLLHVILVMQRLDPATGARQKLFDLLFADMDRSLREMGVGDMSIGKKIKPMIAAFYGRAKSYEEALQQTPEGLIEVLRRNLYRKSAAKDAQIAHMAHYVQAAHSLLATQAGAAIAAGQVRFPTLAQEGTSP